MKKTFRFVGMAVMALLMAVSFTACSDDDEKGGGDSALVGTWEAEDDYGTYTLVFKSDGTYKYTGIDEYDGEEWSHKGTWEAKNGAVVFHVTWNSEDGKCSYYYGFDYEIDGRYLYCFGDDEDEDMVFRKKK